MNEKQNNNTNRKVMTIEQLFDEQGVQLIESKSARNTYNDATTIHLVLYKNHFMPLLDSLKLAQLQQSRVDNASADEQELADKSTAQFHSLGRS